MDEDILKHCHVEAMQKRDSEGPEIDLALVAFYNKETALILCVNKDSGIYWDMESAGQDVVEGLLDDTSPDHGIWIWEGKVTWTYSYEGDGEPDYNTRAWRQPTATEWMAIHAQRNPFDVLPTEEVLAEYESLQTSLAEAIAETIKETAKKLEDDSRQPWGRRTEL
jgi:hypothetical protein